MPSELQLSTYRSYYNKIASLEIFCGNYNFIATIPGVYLAPCNIMNRPTINKAMKQMQFSLIPTNTLEPRAFNGLSWTKNSGGCFLRIL